MEPSQVWQIIILIILLILSGFFSMSETALMALSKIRIRHMVEDGVKGAKLVEKLTEDPNKLLGAILIGNNIVNILASSLATTLFVSLVGPSGVGIATAVMTVLVLIFGEITPKSIAKQKSEEVSLKVSKPINIIVKVLKPFVGIFTFISGAFIRMLGGDPKATEPFITEEELKTMVGVSEEEGVLEGVEKEMIFNVFDFADSQAKDVMVPRVHVTFADVNCTYEELIDIFREDKFTRLPIYEDTTDNVIGTINMKDLLLYDYGNTKEFHIRDIMREAYFTYEYKNISELLVEMRQTSFNIAIVLDEYGETSGLITLEDILEEIVGEIHDEYDENEEDFVHKISDKEYLVEGSVNLDDFNDRLELNLESEEYDSLGGFIIEHLDRLPELGDSVTTSDGIRLVVESLDKNRIEKVHVYLPEKVEYDEDSEE